MTKTFISSIVLLSGLSLAASQVAKDGWVEFYSTTPMETIQAATTTAVSKFDPVTGALSIRMRNTTFAFANKLMQEHFNENYMESEKFPVSGFDGTVKDLDAAALDAGKKLQVTIEGSLDVHGVKKHRAIPATLWKLPDGTVHGECVFPVKMADHGIKIPSLLTKKFTEEMRVTAKFSWKPEVKK
jgi:polyisoprenoid-binding protein YceI